MRRSAIVVVAFAAAGVIAILALAASGNAASRTTCAYRDSGVLPDPVCTPGALNPSVTQGDIRSTICTPGWTATVRPSASVTGREKLASMRQYSDAGIPARAFEYDHLIPLELGGAVNDPQNLWPEMLYLYSNGHAVGARAKDVVENDLRAQVCAGTRTLHSAQLAIAHDWRMVF